MIETREKKYILTLDVGGTFLKSALISSDGALLKGSFRRILIDSQASTEVIMETFVRALRPSLQMANNLKLNVIGMGISVPEFFDFKKGISLMKQKMGAIYGLNLRHEFIQRLKLREDFLIQFEVDAWEFLKGEAWRGVAQGYNRIVGLTLGTGLGSAFMIENQIVIEGSGIPWYGWIGGLPYNDGIVEDKISRHGIITRYKELGGKEYSKGLDVEEIAFRGLKYGDKTSLQLFEELGLILGQVLKPIISDFKGECLVLGGQISKSFPLFAKSLKKQLQSIHSLKKITRARLIDSAALYGVAKSLFRGKKDSEMIKINEEDIQRVRKP